MKEFIASAKESSETIYITHNEAKKAIKNGEAVLFHFQGRAARLYPQITIDSINLQLKAPIRATIFDTLHGKYSMAIDSEEKHQ